LSTPIPALLHGATQSHARGFRRKISDRLDLTLECVRLHHLAQASPLSDVLARYDTFFALFRDFDGYVDFFHLQDLVTPDRSRVRFHLPFDDFASSARPTDVDTYRKYAQEAIDFIQARNRRIASLNIVLD